MASEIETSYNKTTTNNLGFNAASALQIRLETDKLLENIELFLRGARIVVSQDEKGRIRSRQVCMGRSKANPLGIQSILNWIQLILNPQVVQGNFPSDGPGHSSMYEDYVVNVRIDFVVTLTTNCYNWDVADEDINLIVDSVMNAIEPFMTRLIDNLERESYESTVKHLEHNTLKEGGEKLKFFGGSG